MIPGNSYEVISAHEIDEQKLFDYYSVLYPNRVNSLTKNWKWQNRSDYYNNSVPLVMCNESNDIIAHFGMMPFKMLLDNVIYDAHWLIDFSVHPEYQRKGLGHIMTDKIMEFSDIQITCCNEKAIKIFLEFGMKKYDASFYHLFLLKPFNHKKLRRYLPVSFRNIFN